MIWELAVPILAIGLFGFAFYLLVTDDLLVVYMLRDRVDDTITDAPEAIFNGGQRMHDWLLDNVRRSITP